MHAINQIKSTQEEEESEDENNDDYTNVNYYELLKHKLKIYTKYVTASQATTKNKAKMKKANEVKSIKAAMKNTIEMKKERCFNWIQVR